MLASRDENSRSVTLSFGVRPKCAEPTLNLRIAPPRPFPLATKLSLTLPRPPGDAPPPELASSTDSLTFSPLHYL